MPLNFRHTVTIRILASLNIWYVPLMISADSTFKLNLRICLQILINHSTIDADANTNKKYPIRSQS